MGPLPGLSGAGGGAAAAAAAGEKPEADDRSAASSTKSDDKKKAAKDDKEASASGSSPVQQASAAPTGLPANVTAAMLQPYAFLSPAQVAMPSPAVAAASAAGAPNLQLLQAQDIQARLNLLNSMRMMTAQPNLLAQLGGSMPNFAAAGVAPGSSSAAAPTPMPNLNDPNVSALLLELARSRGQQMP